MTSPAADPRQIFWFQYSALGASGDDFRQAMALFGRRKMNKIAFIA
jgi:hypothetical protein